MQSASPPLQDGLFAVMQMSCCFPNSVRLRPAREGRNLSSVWGRGVVCVTVTCYAHYTRFCLYEIMEVTMVDKESSYSEDMCRG